MLRKFKAHFANIQTGWKFGDSCFTAIESGKISTANVSDACGPIQLARQMLEGKIFPRNVLLQAALVIETGVLSVGGMNQITFGTDVKQKAVSFLDSIGEHVRAKNLADMPTDRAFLSPVFSLTSGKQPHFVVTSYDDYLSGAADFGLISADQIMGMDARSALVFSGPALYKFLTKKKLSKSFYDEMQVAAADSGATLIKRQPRLSPRKLLELKR